MVQSFQTSMEAGEEEAAALMATKNRYNIPRPTWTCPHCGFVHYAADIVRLDDEGPECKRCGLAFVAASAHQPSQ
jgi:rubrerythrin